jgi:ABC-type uncharacterized transport system auxiliary subunit
MFSVNPIHATKPTQIIDADLLVDNTNIAPAFFGRQFVYRMTELTYKKDFYNVFFIPANQQITQLLLQAFKQSNYFSGVVSPGSIIPAKYLLKTYISALNADYRNHSKPNAIVAIDVSLYQHTDDGIIELLNKSYSQRTVIKPHNSNGLVYAWSADLSKLLPIITYDAYQAIVKHERSKQMKNAQAAHQAQRNLS